MNQSTLPLVQAADIQRESSGVDGQASSDSEGASRERVDLTATAVPSGHYDPKNDVILRLEATSASEMRVLPQSCCNLAFLAILL